MVSERTWEASGVSEGIGFFAALDAVDRQGWDGSAASALLCYARSNVVEPLVNRRGLFGEARERAIAAGWLAAWEALRSPAIRTATSPWGLVRLKVIRGIKGDFIAERYKMSPRQAWRRYADGIEPAASGVVTISLDQELAKGRDVPQSFLPNELGEHLQLIRDALVSVGWHQELAHDALIWCAANYSGAPRTGREKPQPLRQARTAAGEAVEPLEVIGRADAYPNLCCPGCDARVTAGCPGSGGAPYFRLRAGHSHGTRCEHSPGARVRGFRLAASRIHVAEWQLRRLASLVCGGVRHPGLVELVVTGGPSVLGHDAVQRCLRATISRWSACPSSTLAERYAAGRQVEAA